MVDGGCGDGEKWNERDELSMVCVFVQERARLLGPGTMVHSECQYVFAKMGLCGKEAEQKKEKWTNHTLGVLAFKTT